MVAIDTVRYLRNSESEVWRDCKLKWYLSYYLGFLSDTTIANFWLGNFVHYCLSEWYLGRCKNPAQLFWMISEEWLNQRRGFSISIDGEELEFDDLAEIEEYQMLGVEMLEGYVEWAETHDDFDVLDSELAYYIPLTDHNGREFTFVCRIDLLSENSEGIWVRDFKTAKDLRDSETVHTYMQFRRYPWAIAKAHPDWAEDVKGSVWVALRKMSPATNPRSKPPYYDNQEIDLTPNEIEQVEFELLAEATEILEAEFLLNDGVKPRHLIYPTPTFDCKWKCQFYKNGLCLNWRQGLDVTAAGELHGSWGNDHYEEYKTDDEASVLTIGRREGD